MNGLNITITKPSRMTLSCATLIDNVFVNIMGNNVKSGLIIKDISDHLPIFLTFNHQIKRKKKENNCKYVGVRTEEVVNKFRNDLLREEWKEVDVEEVNDALVCHSVIHIVQ